jgi:hypothetical protein
MGNKRVISGSSWKKNPTKSLTSGERGSRQFNKSGKSSSHSKPRDHKSVIDAGFEPERQILKTRFGMTEP